MVPVKEAVNFIIKTSDKRLKSFLTSRFLDMVLGNMLKVSSLSRGLGPDDFERSLPTITIL